MANIGHNQPHVSIHSLSSEDKKKVKSAIQSLNDSMTRAMSEREFQKETINKVFEEIGLDKKTLRRMAKAYFRSNFNDEVEENKNFEELYTFIVKDPTNG